MATGKQDGPIRAGSLLIAAAALAAATAWSAPSLAGDRDRARELFQDGMRLFAEGSHAEALAAFEESYWNVPKTSVLYHIGRCRAALGRYVEAAAAFRGYLREAGGEAEAGIREEVEAALADIETKIGVILIEGAPDGARVLLDGRPVGNAPLPGPLQADPGEREIAVLADGMKPFSAVVDVRSEETASVPVELEAAEPDLPPAPPAEPAPAAAPAPGPPAAAEAPEEKESTALETWGAVATGVGAAGVLVGAYFTYQGEKDHSAGESAAYWAQYANELRDREAYDSEADRYDEAESSLVGDRIGAIVGYVAGGVLLVSGVVMLILDALEEAPTGGEGARATVAPGGAAVLF